MRSLFSAGCLFVLAACQNGVAVMPPPEAPVLSTGWAGEPPAVEVFPESEPGEKLRLADSAVLLHTRWQGTNTGDHQRVELVAPNGQVYETVTGRLDDKGQADVRLMLAGSFIEEFQLHGTWKARVYYNSAEAPVKETTFEVEP